MMRVTTEMLVRMQRRIPERMQFLLALAADLTSMRYTIVRLDPVTACNLRCQMCYFGSPEWRAAHRPRSFTPAEIDWLAGELFPTALQVYVGCSAEPTVSKHYRRVLELAKGYGVPHVALVSNGQLLTQSDIEHFVRIGVSELILSLHGVRKETYERLMVGASFERFTALLDTIDQVRAASGGQSFKLRLNYTVSAENVEELGDFFQVLGRHQIDTIQLRPIIDLGYETYSGRSLEAVKRDYRSALDRMQVECERRGVNLLYNADNVEYSSEKAQRLRLSRCGAAEGRARHGVGPSISIGRRRARRRSSAGRDSACVCFAMRLVLPLRDAPETQFNTSQIL